MAKIITTREIYVHLNRGSRTLERTTTKHVDASIKVIQPKNPQKPVALTTAGLPDVQEIIDKKKRDDIMAQRRLYEKETAKKEKKKAKVVKKAFEKGDAIYQDSKGEVVVIPKKRTTIEEATEEAGEVVQMITHPVAKDGESGSTISGEQEIEVKKKAWKEMTEEERQEVMKKQMEEPMESANVNLEKKPMKEMTQEEKKIAMKERMKKVREGKKKKK